MTNKNENRLRQIIRKQNIIKLKAGLKASNRQLNLKLRRDAAEANKQLPKAKPGLRIRDRHLLQIVLGTLNERSWEWYKSCQLHESHPVVLEMIEARPHVAAKLAAIELGLSKVS